MARLPRLALAGHAHAVLQRGQGARPVFVDDTDRQAYLHALQQALATERCALHAFALDDHEVRLLATPETAEALGGLMQAVGRRYVSAYNRRHGGAGSLWAGRFRSAVVAPGPLLRDALLWVESTAAAPSCNSAAQHGGGARWPWLTDPPEYWALGNTPFERQHQWQALLAQGLPVGRAALLRAAVLGGWAAGDEGFLRTLSTAVARPSQPRPRGRPRKT